MTDEQALKFTNDVFYLIRRAVSVSDLEAIPIEFDGLIENSLNNASYPKIQFSINSEEIQSLIENNSISEDLSLDKNISSKLSDPLTKLLYAMAWKNGDLIKLKHIIKGILDINSINIEQDEALVFYQFGKYLTKTGQPIIDQHVIRAFAIYDSGNADQTRIFRKISSVNKTHKEIIILYKKWLASDELTLELRSEIDYRYYIDKLLFATGKAIKSYN